MTKETDSEHEQSSIPSWIKSTGAIVGILAALSGAIVGASQVVSSWRQFQLQVADKEREAADARFRQAAEETKQTDAEARMKETAGKQEIEVKKTELATAEANRKSAELALTRDHQAQEAAEKFKIAGEMRINQRNDENRLIDSIGSLFGKDASGSLATLSRYAKPGDENLSTILTPLVAKLAEVESPSEVSIIFQVFNKSGPTALNAVLDANRVAFEKYKQDIREIARLELAAELKRRTEAGDRYPDRYTVQMTVSRLITSTYVGSPGLAWLTDRIVRTISFDSLGTGEKTGILVIQSKLQLDILSQSKRSLVRLLDPSTHSLDLSEVDLTDVKFPRRDNEIAVNFRGACLIGADLSGLNLDRASLLSIREADFGNFSGYQAEQEFLRSIFATVRLSELQRDIISNSLKRLD